MEKNGRDLPTTSREYIFEQQLISDRQELLDGKQLNFGPLFHITTSKGNELEVITLNYENNQYGRNKRSYFIYGIMSGIGVAARRTSVIEYAPDENSVTGRLDTGIKGQGFGTTLELVHEIVLQNEANINGRISWVITDQNYNHVLVSKRLLSMENNDLNRQQHEEAVKEHNRWKKIYDRFPGVDILDQNKPKKIVTFYPDRSIPLLSDVKSCKMVRTGSHANITETTPYTSEQDKANDQAYKMDLINKVLSISR